MAMAVGAGFPAAAQISTRAVMPAPKPVAETPSADADPVPSEGTAESGAEAGITPVEPVLPPVRPARRLYRPPRIAQVIGTNTDAFVSAITLGAEVSRGNTQSASYRGGFDFAWHFNGISWDWQNVLSYGESRDVEAGETDPQVTSDYGSSVLSGRQRFGRHEFWGLEGVARYDTLAKIDHRFVLSPGVGRLFLDRPDRQFSMEVGVAQVWESVDGVSRDWPALRLGERFEQKIKDGALIRQTIEWLPNPTDWQEYYINADFSVEMNVQGRLSFVVRMTDQYTARPAEGAEPNDFSFSTCVRYLL